MRTTVVALAVSIFLSAAASAQQVPQAQLISAAQKALSLLESTSEGFTKKGGCNSCHNQFLPAAAQAFAKSHGVPTGPKLTMLPSEVSEATTERYVEYSIAGGGGIASLGFDFFAHIQANDPATPRMLSQVHYIKGVQEVNGSWKTAILDRRPPLASDDFTPTAYMVLAISRYAPQTEAADTRDRINRARAWMMATQATRTQERAFKLLGLAWSKADASAIAAAVKDLQSTQSADGGWQQLSTLPSDAYATGMALYALNVGGVPASDPVYQKGLKYLLSTQAADGTWHVKTRALPFQPYLEIGYPYDHDQWISAAGAAYATMAIAAAVEPANTRSAQR